MRGEGGGFLPTPVPICELLRKGSFRIGLKAGAKDMEYYRVICGNKNMSECECLGRPKITKLLAL